MSLIEQEFWKIKDALHNAMHFAEPETVLKNAEHDFLAKVAGMLANLEQRVSAMEGKISPVVADPEPAPAAPAAAPAPSDGENHAGEAPAV